MQRAADATATEHDAPGIAECEQQVRRVVQSATFRNATTLQQLFEYLASKTIAGTPEVLKEYTIGVEALGRRSDFDPKSDPIVRVQSHRLRVKLKEYYDAEGSHDPILIHIPKGHYLPRFEVVAAPDSDHKQSESSSTPSVHGKRNHEAKVEDHPSTKEEKRPFAWLFLVRAAVATAIVLIFAIGFWLGIRQAHSNAATDSALTNQDSPLAKSPDPVKAFWANFLGNDTAPVIAYPDAVFLLDNSNDLFRFRQGASDGRGALVDPHLARQFASNRALVAEAGQLYYENGYTGTGELEAVGMLAGLLGRMGIKPTIKSSRDIDPDDLKQHNVILLGSPFQNIAVAQLLTSGDFAFKNPDPRFEQWRAQIINAHPLPSEQSTYGTERDPTTQVLKADYSLISIVPGVVPGRYIAVIGGLDTKGTEGATLFATSRQGIEELTKTLSSSGPTDLKGEIPIFQALVRVQLAKGYQVLGANLTAVHRFHPAAPSQNVAANGSVPAR